MRKMKIFIADFHVLGLFMAKKHDLSDKKNPSATRRCRTQNLYFTYRLGLLSARKLKLWLSESFGPT
jgi:hypothetical protein